MLVFLTFISMFFKFQVKDSGKSIDRAEAELRVLEEQASVHEVGAAAA